MSMTVKQRYEGGVSEITTLIAAAAENAETEWESEFIQDMEHRVGTYGERAYVSDKQHETLISLAGA